MAINTEKLGLHSRHRSENTPLLIAKDKSLWRRRTGSPTPNEVEKVTVQEEETQKGKIKRNSHNVFGQTFLDIINYIFY